MATATIGLSPVWLTRLGYVSKLRISCADNDKSVYPYMRAAGQYEPHVQHLICSMVKKGQTVLDIGANYGQHTALMSLLVGEAGTVIAIEASAANFEHLKETCRLNEADKNVQFINVGVWSEPIKLSFRHRDDSAACDFFSTTGWDKDKHPESFTDLDTQTLDSLVQVNPDFVKMDIEGSELHALMGGRGVFQHCPPLLIELNAFTCSNFFGIKINEVISYLMDAMGYNTITAFVPERRDWIEIPRSIIERLFDDGVVLIDAFFTKK